MGVSVLSNVIDEIEVLERSPMLNHVHLHIEENPEFSDALSERRSYSDGMGELLRWWKFDDSSANRTEYKVLVPAHKGSDNLGNDWILNGLTGKIHSNF